MGDEDHTAEPNSVSGHPYDNASVAQRLGGEAFSVERDGLVFDGFRVAGRAAASATDGAANASTDGTTDDGDGAAERDGAADREGASAAGVSEEDRPVAVLVHGWPQFAACWEETARALADAGIDVIAYDQRGYSPGARPDDVADYDVAKLVGDLHGLVHEWGLGRFHLVGHDWGGIVGWSYAAMHPDELATFTSVSTAHPIAHGQRIAEDPDQYERMHYLRRIRQDPAGVEERLLADDGARLAAMYEGAIDDDRVRSYVERFSQPGTMEAALKYYRALGGDDSAALTGITVPTLYVWGSEDLAFSRGAAELTGDHVDADYRFVEIPGATHWLPEEEPRVVSGAVIDWIREH